MHRALRFRNTLLFCNVVVSVACVPFFSMRMLVNFGEFLNAFGSPLEPFLDWKWTNKSCLSTLCIAYMQSSISNTPYRVLKVFHPRGSVEIQEKSLPNRIRNRFAFDVVAGIIF